MSGRQKIFNLPYPRMANKGLNQQMLVLLDRNLLEIERQLSFTQLYQEDTVKEVIDSSGNLKTDKLDDKTVGLEYALQIANQAVTTAKIALNAVTEALLADGAVTNLKLAAGAVTAAKTNWQTHLLSDYAIANNTPMIGFVSWSGVKIVYKGQEYEVMDGSTDKLYIWWDFDYPTIMQTAQILPTMADDDALVFLNKNGTYLVVPKATVVDGSLLVSESVLTDALAANAVTSIKIAAEAVLAVHLAAKSVTAEKINVENLAAISANLGTVNAGFINVGDKILDITDMATAHDGQVQNDANVTAYFPLDDSLYDSKNLIQCTFARDSLAYLPNGVQVASGIARYDTARIVRGVMIEEGTTNLITEQNISTWSKESTVDCIALDNRFYKIYKTATSSLNMGTYKDFSVQPNTVYTVSFDVRGGNDNAWFGIGGDGGDGNWNGYTGGYKQYVLNSRNIFTFTTSATATTVRIYFTNKPNQVDSYVEIRDIQLEQKAYHTSFIPSTRAPEILTIPTAGIFQKGNWTVDLTYIPHTSHDGSKLRILWYCKIDANNNWLLFVTPDGKISLRIISNGRVYSIVYENIVVPNNIYCISTSGDGNKIKLFINGLQIGTNVDYVEPLGDLPLLVTIGWAGTTVAEYLCNGIIDELRFSKITRTLLEHQTYYNSKKGFTDIEPIIRPGQIYGGFMITPDGSAKAYQEDGSYTKMGSDGLNHYSAGDKKSYHYLTEINRASTVGTGYRGYDASPPDNVKLTGEEEYLIYVPPITVQLPEDFKGKNFEVFAELRMNGKNLDTYYRRVVLAMAFGSVRDILWVCEVYDYDYINATFKIKAYSYMHGYEANKARQWYEMVDGVDISYIVTA